MSNQPSHDLYVVIQGRDDNTDGQPVRGYWRKIGAAWENRDGKGYTLAFDCFPIDGRVVMRAHDDGRSHDDVEPPPSPTRRTRR